MRSCVRTCVCAGVYLTDEVLQDMMRYFDTNQDQKVDYGEFVARMFPSRAKMH